MSALCWKSPGRHAEHRPGAALADARSAGYCAGRRPRRCAERQVRRALLSRGATSGPPCTPLRPRTAALVSHTSRGPSSCRRLPRLLINTCGAFVMCHNLRRPQVVIIRHRPASPQARQPRRPSQPRQPRATAALAQSAQSAPNPSRPERGSPRRKAADPSPRIEAPGRKAPDPAGQSQGSASRPSRRRARRPPRDVAQLVVSAASMITTSGPFVLRHNLNGPQAVIIRRETVAPPNPRPAPNPAQRRTRPRRRRVLRGRHISSAVP